MQQGSGALTMDSYQLKRRSDLHLARKLWHIFGVLGMVVVHHQLTSNQALKLSGTVAAGFLITDLIRQHVPALNRFFMSTLGMFMREHERHRMAGTTYLLAGTFIIVWLFPREVVSLTLLFLAFADPLASYVGIRFGKDKLVGPKSLQGTVAAFATCTIISVVYLLANGLMTERIIMVSLLAGIIGALSELIPVGRLDDNLTFPILNGFGLWVIFYVFGGLV
jgi:diacylglycerol kinase (CTP)